MRKYLIATFIGIIGLLSQPQKVQAAILEKTLDRQYTVTATYVDVVQTLSSHLTDRHYLVPAGSVDTFIVFNPIISDPGAQKKLQKALATISVTDKNGQKLNFTTEVSGQNILIKVPKTHGLLFGQTDIIKVSYKNYSLVTRNGALLDLYIPSFAKGYKFSSDDTNIVINSTVIIPQKLGEINFITPQKQAVKVDNNWEVKFTGPELTGIVSWIQIGTTQYYSFDIKQPYTATTRIPLFFNTYSVLLPREINYGGLLQDIKFTTLDPAPDSVTEDSDGNLVAKFSVPANQNGTIHIAGFAKVHTDNAYDITKAGKLSDVPQNMKSLTEPGQYWEVDSPEIQKAAADIKGNEDDIYKLLTKTYKFVVDRIDYSEVKRFGINERQGALKTLEGGAAVCMEYSDLFIALMRAEGIPARAAFGYGYDSRATSGIDTAHQWAEVYLPKQDAWVSVDTTWGESGNMVIGGNLNHFSKYTASTNPNIPAPISVAYFGTSNQIPSDDFQILALESLPVDKSAKSISELTAEFNPTAQPLAGVTNLFRSFNLAITTVDHWLENFLTTKLSLNNNLVTIVKFIVYIIGVIIIVGACYLIAHQITRLRKQLITNARKT